MTTTDDRDRDGNISNETELTDSAYSRIYGRLPIPRSYVPIAAPSRASYYGDVIR
ncbi:hypothetical protein DAPPUDRAFT_245211 [Daphnia pulex]|uniref:Uncharacterized protein n=1 Tax=Daphnia pulex TaxID=6669 RepID=E9GMT6_DAPPU|nr:hypothetical protein DAPPUDRAFT_245211 [Daphnia pulex]|eukprot:EFX79232.1 hypothetical protein DAPPUDRAFT_245211 [Daphnia pulex]